MLTKSNAPSRYVTRRPGASRMFWWRAHHGLPSHPRWLSVARKASVGVPTAFTVAIWVLDAASRGQPRGSIMDFSVCACAAYLNVDDVEVERVMVVLRDSGWITQDQVVNWDERQPQREDATASERQAAHRAKLRNGSIASR